MLGGRSPICKYVCKYVCMAYGRKLTINEKLIRMHENACEIIEKSIINIEDELNSMEIDKNVLQIPGRLAGWKNVSSD